MPGIDLLSLSGEFMSCEQAFWVLVFRVVRIAVGRRLLNRSTDISTPCIGLSGAFNKNVVETISFSSLVGRWLTLDNGLPRFCLQFSESNHSNFPWTEKWRIYLTSTSDGRETGTYHLQAPEMLDRAETLMVSRSTISPAAVGLCSR